MPQLRENVKKTHLSYFQIWAIALPKIFSHSIDELVHLCNLTKTI